MVGKSLYFNIIFIMCIFFLAGCSNGNKKPQEVGLTAAEQQKAALLRQVERNYKDPDSHYQLGKLYQADALWTQAEHEFTVALGFDPVHRKSQAARVKTLAQSGDIENSKLSADFYINQASATAMGSLELAMAFQKEELDEYAFTCYQQALSLAPNSAKVNRQIGYYYLSKSDQDRGKDYLVRSFQLNQNQPEVAGTLGRLGIAVQVGKKTRESTKSLDRMIEKSDEEILQ
jgi:tetratricopeptide (TPR) repeat protein